MHFVPPRWQAACANALQAWPVFRLSWYNSAAQSHHTTRKLSTSSVLPELDLKPACSVLHGSATRMSTELCLGQTLTILKQLRASSAAPSHDHACPAQYHQISNARSCRDSVSCQRQIGWQVCFWLTLQHQLQYFCCRLASWDATFAKVTMTSCVCVICMVVPVLVRSWMAACDQAVLATLPTVCSSRCCCCCSRLCGHRKGRRSCDYTPRSQGVLTQHSSLTCNHVNKPSFASCVVLWCSLGKFCHCPQGNGRSSSMKSGSGTSVGLTRSLNTLQPRQKKTVQGLFHLAHLALQRIVLHWQLHMWHCIICLKDVSPPLSWAGQDTFV